MTDASRQQHILQALRQHNEQQGGTRDTLRVPLRGYRVLEVVEVPLNLPALNADSFRIAPLLEDHPRAHEVRRDPYSPEAQEIVAGLVRKAHRHADELKESLIDGQDQPGVITRNGKLINANTRCVLLRELGREGKIPSTTIRVAVLPADVTGAEELELESVLQKQKEHKDEYNLVSELMMIKKLHEGAQMSDAAIARRLRISGGTRRVADLRAVLDLMERARYLTTTPLPLAEFIGAQDQRQNWLELLGRVNGVDADQGRQAGDDHIRRWLLAFHLGQDSVHRLRNAVGPWVEKDVLGDLAEGDGVAASVATAVNTPPAASATSQSDAPLLDGLHLLGEEPAPDPHADSVAVQRLLDLAVDTKRAGDGDVTLPDGEKVPAPDVRETLNRSVVRGLDAVRRRAAAGTRLNRPGNGLTQARNGLRDALDALDEVVDDPEFGVHRDNVVGLVDEVTTLVERVSAVLETNEADIAYRSDA